MKNTDYISLLEFIHHTDVKIMLNVFCFSLFSM